MYYVYVIQSEKDKKLYTKGDTRITEGDSRNIMMD